jgi:hypothetical protein
MGKPLRRVYVFPPFNTLFGTIESLWGYETGFVLAFNTFISRDRKKLNFPAASCGVCEADS